MADPDSPAPEQRFSNRVENYVRYRPGYPPEILDLLKDQVGLAKGAVVADVGSGTGISSEWLLKRGAVVFGVEPNREMRGAAGRLLAGYPDFHSVDGKASATKLAPESMDFIVAAQAFHWFGTPETRAEFSRILKPGGHLVLMWNERKLEATPFLREYEALLQHFGTDYAEVRHEMVNAEVLGRFFIGEYATHTFQNRQRFDFESLKGRLLSSSYAPAEGHSRHEPMVAGLHRIFDLHQENGQVALEYDTRVHLGR